MTMQRLFSSVVVVFGVSQAHAADVTLAGAAYGGPSQGQAVCYLVNAGSVAVAILSKEFLPEAGFVGPRPLVYDTCGFSVDPGAMCAFVSNIPSNGGNACKVVLQDVKKAEVRGTLEIRDSGNNILNTVELR